MKKLLRKIERIIYNPTIKAKLVNGGRNVKCKYTAVSPEQAIIILYSTVKQTARTIGIPERQLMNEIVRLDKKIIRDQKKSKKK